MRKSAAKTTKKESGAGNSGPQCIEGLQDSGFQGAWAANFRLVYKKATADRKCQSGDRVRPISARKLEMAAI